RSTSSRRSHLRAQPASHAVDHRRPASHECFAHSANRLAIARPLRRYMDGRQIHPTRRLAQVLRIVPVALRSPCSDAERFRERRRHPPHVVPLLARSAANCARLRACFHDDSTWYALLQKTRQRDRRRTPLEDNCTVGAPNADLRLLRPQIDCNMLHGWPPSLAAPTALRLEARYRDLVAIGGQPLHQLSTRDDSGAEVTCGATSGRIMSRGTCFGFSFRTSFFAARLDLPSACASSSSQLLSFMPSINVARVVMQSRRERRGSITCGNRFTARAQVR